MVPLRLSLSKILYCSKLVNRIAIFGAIPINTAPSPLYRASTDSFLAMPTPVLTNPILFPYIIFGLCAVCIRTLIVSKGWQTKASMIPAPPPANKFCNIGASALVFGSWAVLVVDMWAVLVAIWREKKRG